MRVILLQKLQNHEWPIECKILSIRHFPVNAGEQPEGGYNVKIAKMVFSKGMTGFFFDDQRAIKKHAISDGCMYIGEPVTDGFTAVRQAGEAISVVIVLEDGQIAYGDCAAVQYSGAGGRDPLFLFETSVPLLRNTIAPLFIGRELTSFRDLAEEIDTFVNPATGKCLHTALRYGITQALLDAVAKSRHKLMVDVIAEEYSVVPSNIPIPIFGQSGDDRYRSVDKMILKSVDVLPHGLFNHIDKIGANGEKLIEYILWLKSRIEEFRDKSSYKPVIHLDVYGMLGQVFGMDFDKMMEFLVKVDQAAAPFTIRIEGPVDTEDREGTLHALQVLTRRSNAAGLHVQIVADEWCNTLQDIKEFADRGAGHMLQIKTPDLGGINNTIEAVIYCKQKGVGAYQGGTCNETDRSAQVCVHMAMATGADQVLAKPGMGFDEGYMIVYNEMQRILALKQVL
jgi:methylaspartate ammonia-lyase